MKQKWVGLILALSLTAACDSAGGFGRSDDNPYAPTGHPTRQQSVDGLIVGHRLMAAGEFELALKAYYRAAGKVGLNVDTYSALGSANLKLGRLGQAEKLLRQAVEKDATFAPAWNNLGVVLMERGKAGEAMRVFQTAYALDSGESDSIRDNLRLAIAKTNKTEYVDDNDTNFSLVRRGSGEYLLLSTP
jgi:Flp pilus assembly protein TadD